MSKRLTFVSAAALVIGLAGPIHAQETTAETVVATVNGVEIKLGHMIMTRAALPERFQQMPTDVLFPGILDQIIQQIVLEQTIDGDLPAAVQYSLDNQRRAAMAQLAIDSTIEGVATEDALQAEYQAAFADAEVTQEFNAAHILVETEDAAKALTEEARGGADFAALAQEHSTGPSGPSGGSLGWFGPGMMVKPFETAVSNMEVGGVSEPVETQFGWHVIKLNEIREKSGPSFEDVRAQLKSQIEEKAITDQLTALTEAADIDRSVADGLDASILDDASLMAK